MNFYGADTEALRRQARTFEACGRTMLESTAVLSTAVLSVSWEGPDADDLRQRWGGLERRLRDAADRTVALAGDLEEHADEQDTASAADDGSGLLDSLWDQLGFGDPSGLLDDAASRFSDWIGSARDLAGAVAPGSPGGGRGNPLLAALDPGSPATSGMTPFLDAVRGSSSPGPSTSRYSGDYDNPEDEFDVTPGEGGKETTRSLSVGGKSVEVTTDADGNHSTKVEISRKLVDAKGGPVSIEAEISTSGEKKVNGDGTVTYTMTAEQTAEASAKVGSKGPVSLSGSSSEGAGTSTEYAVTVPEGMPMDQVLGINPFDPSSIPAGASVTFESSASRTSSDSGSAGAYGIDLVTVTGEDTSEIGRSTSVGRNGDGSLTVTTGPTDRMVGTGKLQLGPEGLNVYIGTRKTDTGATFETATFTDDAAGHTAYHDALTRGRFPDDAGNGVISTYTERQESHVKDSIEGWNLGGASSESTQNWTRHDVITRTYPDGHQESAEQWLPMGDRSTNSVVKSSASDRPSTFAVQLDSSIETGAYVENSEYERQYGVAPGDRAGIMLTEQEAYQIRDNMVGKGAVPEDGSTGEILSRMLNDNQNSDAGMDDLTSGYNRNPDGSVDATKPAPGTPYSPASQAVRDGKIVDTSEPSTRPGLQR